MSSHRIAPPPGGGPFGEQAMSPLAAGNRHHRPRRKSSRHLLRRTLIGLLAFVIIVPLAVFAVGYIRADVPHPSDMRTNQVATITASDGKSVITRVVPPEGNRTEVPLQQVPELVRNAVLSAEDRNFYDNPGFSLSGISRAVWAAVSGGAPAGSRSAPCRDASAARTRMRGFHLVGPSPGSHSGAYRRGRVSPEPKA